MNALSPLGMVSEIPSENQTSDSAGIEVQKDYFVQKDGVKFAGTHLLVDLWGASNLSDPELIDRACREAALAAGATILHSHFHHFSPNGGVSGVVVLAESPHLDPHLARARFRGGGHLHVRRLRSVSLGPRAEGGVPAGLDPSRRAAARPHRLMAADSWINETLYPTGVSVSWSSASSPACGARSRTS